VHAERRPPKEIVIARQGTISIDFGHVGDVVKINARLVDRVAWQGLSTGYFSLGADRPREQSSISTRYDAAGNRGAVAAEKLKSCSPPPQMSMAFTCRGKNQIQNVHRTYGDEAEAMITTAPGHGRNGMTSRADQFFRLHCAAFLGNRIRVGY